MIHPCIIATMIQAMLVAIGRSLGVPFVFAIFLAISAQGKLDPSLVWPNGCVASLIEPEISNAFDTLSAPH